MDWEAFSDEVTIHVNHMRARTKHPLIDENPHDIVIPTIIMTNDQAMEWKTLAHIEKAQCLSTCSKTVQSLLNKLTTAMQAEQIAQHYQRCRNKMDNGEGEIKRALHKITPTKPIWGVTTKQRDKIHPWVITIHTDHLNIILQWLSCEQALLSHGQPLTPRWQFLHSPPTTIQLRQQGTTVDVGIFPISQLSTLLLNRHASLGLFTISAPPDTSVHHR